MPIIAIRMILMLCMYNIYIYITRTYIFPSMHNLCLLRKFYLLWFKCDFTPWTTFAISGQPVSWWQKSLNVFPNMPILNVRQSFHLIPWDLWVKLGLTVRKMLCNRFTTRVCTVLQFGYSAGAVSVSWSPDKRKNGSEKIQQKCHAF